MYTQNLKILQNFPSHQILRHMHEVLNIDKKITNCTVTFKSRDESFKLSYSIIRQYLSNKNENTTVSKSNNFLHLNKA